MNTLLMITLFLGPTGVIVDSIPFDTVEACNANKPKIERRIKKNLPELAIMDSDFACVSMEQPKVQPASAKSE